LHGVESGHVRRGVSRGIAVAAATGVGVARVRATVTPGSTIVRAPATIAAATGAAARVDGVRPRALPRIEAGVGAQWLPPTERVAGQNHIVVVVLASSPRSDRHDDAEHWIELEHE